MMSTKRIDSDTPLAYIQGFALHSWRYQLDGVAMALSEHEQRLLEEMERNLYQNEADVVTTLGAAKRAPNYTAIVSGVVMAVVGLGLMLWGVGADLTWLGVLGFVVVFAGVMIAVTIPGPVASAPRQSSSSTRSASSFMDQMNDRWDRRRGGQSL